MDPQVANFLYIAGSIISSVGGASILILGLSSWLGKVWANRILEADKLKYNKELEETKAKYEKEIEEYKHHLEKSKALFMRYSDSQFKLYNEVWEALVKLKFAIEELWETPNSENLRTLSIQLDETFNSIEYHRLLIEEIHYQKLLEILGIIKRFRLNKKLLIGLKNLTDEQIKNLNLESFLPEVIEKNKISKDQYSEILEAVAKDFHKQISFAN